MDSERVTPEMLSRPTRFEAGDLPEAEAIRRAQQGDAAAYERIYRLYNRRVYALCLFMMGNAADAEELTQEAFLQSFRKIGAFRGESAFFIWLHRLSVNVVLMRLRRKKFAETSLEETIKTDEETGGPRKDFGALDLRLSGSADRVNLQRAVGQLRPGYRSVFLLHDVEGYEHREIAEILGCSIGNSKSRLRKARMQLRHLLQEARRHNLPEPARDAELGCPGAIPAARGQLAANVIAMSVFLAFSRVVLFLSQMQIF
jgi:RNA polymerase sigma-70 factor (ECF subfamily)